MLARIASMFETSKLESAIMIPINATPTVIVCTGVRQLAISCQKKKHAVRAARSKSMAMIENAIVIRQLTSRRAEEYCRGCTAEPDFDTAASPVDTAAKDCFDCLGAAFWNC